MNAPILTPELVAQIVEETPANAAEIIRAINGTPEADTGTIEQLDIKGAAFWLAVAAVAIVLILHS